MGLGSEYLKEAFSYYGNNMWKMIYPVKFKLEEKEMQLEVGKRYFRRDGKITGPLEARGDTGYSFWDSLHRTSHKANGMRVFGASDAEDLISEYTENPIEAIEKELAAERIRAGEKLRELEKRLAKARTKKQTIKHGDYGRTTPTGLPRIFLLNNLGGVDAYASDGSRTTLGVNYLSNPPYTIEGNILEDMANNKKYRFNPYAA